MRDFLEQVIEGLVDRMQKILKDAFEAGQQHEAGIGPDFEGWLESKRHKEQN